MLYDAKRIAALMAQARERSGVAQETLAALLHVSPRTVQRWEHGEKPPTLEEFINWYRALSLNWFPDVLRLAHPELYTDLTAATRMWSRGGTGCLNTWLIARRGRLTSWHS